MSFKTDRLVALFPDAYGAAETSTLLYKLLDVFGAEMMQADDRVKRLLKSHWLPYAEGPALDSLAALLGVERRVLATDAQTSAPTYESDDSFRHHLAQLVRNFTGGGTVEAIKGAVRSALGMAFDLDDPGLPPALREELEKLVQVHEFSAVAEERRGNSQFTPRMPNELRQVLIRFDAPSTDPLETFPEIEWRFVAGEGRHVRVQCDGKGFESRSGARFPAGQPLRLLANPDGSLRAFLGAAEVTASFHDLTDPAAPAQMPALPPGGSRWRFSSRTGLFDHSAFDEEENAFDAPEFLVALRRVRHEPLTFVVEAPLGVRAIVDALCARHRYPGKPLLFEPLPLEQIQAVVDHHAAAGVRGSLSYVLHFPESHDVTENPLLFQLQYAAREDAGSSERLTVRSEETMGESHDTGERFAVWLGGRFDVSTFDNASAFQ